MREKTKDYITAGILTSPLDLVILFAILRLTGVIDWSWWLVTLPIWGVFAVVLLLALVYFAVLWYRVHHP